MKTRKDNKNRKARNISLLFHAALVLLALYPIKQSLKDANTSFADHIEIVFSNGDITSGASSTAPAKAPEPVNTPEVKKEMTKKAAPALPPSAPVLEEPESPVKLETNSKATRVETQAKFKEIPVKESDVKEEEASDTPKETTSDNTPEHSKEGEGDHGTHITGKELGEKDFGGNGVFGRKVIYRAPIAKVAKESGVIAVNVCINRRGRVTHAIVYKDKTTITNKEYLRKAKEMATQYRFEEDYTAPDIQCGQLTFIFKIK